MVSDLSLDAKMSTQGPEVKVRKEENLGMAPMHGAFLSPFL